MVGLITAIIFIPLLGALAVWIWPQKNARPIALICNVISAACAPALWRNFDATVSGLQFVERHDWIPAIGAEYLVEGRTSSNRTVRAKFALDQEDRLFFITVYQVRRRAAS